MTSVRSCHASRKIHWFAVSMGCLVFHATSALAGPLLFTGNFETGNLSQFPRSHWEHIYCCAHSAVVQHATKRAGRYALRMTNRRSDTIPRKRAALDGARAPIGSERWYGFSVYLPANWITDVQPEQFAEFFTHPDSHLGESGLNGTLAFRIEGNTVHILNNWDPRPVTTKESVIRHTLWRGSYPRGAWVDWVVHAKWSYKSDGLLQIWRNGTLIVNKRGGNVYNNTSGVDFQFGNYKWPWINPRTTSKVRERVLFFDEIRIGNHWAAYRDVAPGVFRR